MNSGEYFGASQTVGGGVVEEWSFTHVQSEPATLWAIPHNAFAPVLYVALNTAGVEIFATPIRVSDDLLQLSFRVPVAGIAHLKRF